MAERSTPSPGAHHPVNPAGGIYLIPLNAGAGEIDPPPADARLLALRGATMGTGWSLRFVEAAGVSIAGIEAALDAVFADVIAQMSNWEPESFVSRFNRAPAGWTDAPAGFLTVLEAALKVAGDTNGAYNPALLDRTVDAGFGPTAARGNASSASDIWRRVEVDQAAGRAYQPGGAALDFSSIAKGYAVDVAAKRLRGLGIRHLLMEIGGEFVGCGLRPDGQPWRVDLELAAQGTGSVTVAVADVGVATSGNFIRSRIENGRRVGHILDGRSGADVAGGVSAVSVVAPSCMEADAWATALFALGAERGLATADAHGLAAVFMLEDGSGRPILSKAAEAMAE